MDKRERLLEMRRTRKLKGLKPCFIYLKNNIGKIYNGGRAKFVMSLENNNLYFQRLTFFNNLRENDDFYLNCKRFKTYDETDSGIIKTLILYDDEGRYIEIFYKARRKDSASTEENIYRIIEELKKTNKMKEVDHYDTSEEASN